MRSNHTMVVGGGGNQLPLELNGAVPINIQDQTTPPFALYFTQAIGVATTLLASPSINDTELVLTDATDFVAGTFVGVFSGVSGEGRYFFAKVLSKDTNTLTIDTPLDFSFGIGDPVVPLTRNMNVDGSVTPQVFSLSGSAPDAPITIDVTRIMITMETATTPSLGDFGDLAPLVKGLVLRRVDGDTRNIWNVKKNSDFANLAYDVQFYSALGQGVDGLTCRYTFAGQDKHGVVIRLTGGESLEAIIQEDLRGLTQFRIIAEGHIVTD